jgi:hypothetical protein
MALALGAPPDDATRAKVVSRLVENIAANDGRFTFGIVGSAWLFPALESSGHGDIGLSILMTDTYPSVGHFLVENMTTLCENWACQFHEPGGGSQNHIMYGAFDAWMSTALGGLSTVSNTTSTAWQHVLVHPDPAAVVKLGEGSYTLETRFGMTSVQVSQHPNSAFHSALWNIDSLVCSTRAAHSQTLHRSQSYVVQTPQHRSRPCVAELGVRTSILRAVLTHHHFDPLVHAMFALPCFSFQWSRNSDGTVATNVTLPVGSTAEVVHDRRLPGTRCELARVLESGRVVWSADADAQHSAETMPIATEVSSVARTATTTVSVIGSGKYSFHAHYSC